MNLRERALTYIDASADPRELIALSESLRHGRAEAVAADDDGVLVRVGQSGDFLVGARDGHAAARLLGDLAAGELAGSVVALQDADWADEVGFDPGKPLRYRICIYDQSTPVPVRGSLRIGRLAVSDLPVVAEHYKNLPEDFIARHLSDGWVYGGYDGTGELVGFIGEHDEGAIGMLEVLPEHRRRGYAYELEGFLVNHMLEQGRIPFTQVVEDNEASFALQRKLGLTVLPRVQCWNW